MRVVIKTVERKHILIIVFKKQIFEKKNEIIEKMDNFQSYELLSE